MTIARWRSRLTAALLGAALLGGAAGRTEAAPNAAVTPKERGAFQQPVLAVDPTNPQRLAVSYMEAGSRQYCSVALSSDGGRSWVNRKLLGAGAAFPLPPRFEECLDPQVLYGPDGTLYYLSELRNVDHSMLQRKLFLTSSRPRGLFTTPREVDPLGAGTDRSDLAAGMALDPRSGRLYVAFIRSCEPPLPGGDPRLPTPGGIAACLSDPVRILVASSDDEGKTFSVPVAVTPGTAGNPSTEVPAIDAAGTLYVAWIDAGSGPSPARGMLYVAASRDGGRSFAPRRPVVATAGAEAGPAGPCDALRWTRRTPPPPFHLLGGARPGELFLADWDSDAGGRCEVFFQRSDDAGDSWTPRRAVGASSGGGDHQQHRPRLALSPGGRLYVAYYDIGPDDRQDVYLIESADAGDHFSTPRRLTTARSDARIGPPGSGRLADLGGWLGLGSARCGFFAAWTDTRRGTTATAKQDVFAADRCLPSITGLSLTHRVFRVGRRPRGTHFRFRLSEPARVTFLIERRRGREHCRVMRRGCLRYLGVGRFTRTRRAGRSLLRFSGRVGRRLLGPGRYRAALRATDAAGNRSSAKRVRFEVERRR